MQFIFYYSYEFSVNDKEMWKLLLVYFLVSRANNPVNSISDKLLVKVKQRLKRIQHLIDIWHN